MAADCRRCMRIAAYESIATSLGDAANNGYFQAKIAELKARMAS